VVDMRVGDEDLFDLEAELGQAALNAGDLVAGIDHDGFARGFIAKQGAVALQRADREGLEDHVFHGTRVGRVRAQGQRRGLFPSAELFCLRFERGQRTGGVELLPI